MNQRVWAEIEATLVSLLSLPHNRLELSQRGQTAELAARRKIDEMRSGIAGVPAKETFAGPKLFLRVVGPRNRAYSGEWWFEANLLDGLDHAYERLYFNSADRKGAIRNMLREFLAVSQEWNPITEIWALELPSGERLTGYSGQGNRQKLFQDLPLSDKANRMLVGKAKQIYFPVKNPLWVRKHRDLGR